MAYLYPRLSLLTGLLINHDGVFVSQTGFIYWFYHQSSWRVCIPDWVYLLVYLSIMMVCLYPMTGFIYWFTHQSSWRVCIPDWVYLLVYSSIIMACLYPRLGLFTSLPINHIGVYNRLIPKSSMRRTIADCELNWRERKSRSECSITRNLG